MSDIVDYSDVPYLQDILNYLPIDPTDDEDIINYIKNITNLIAVNYKYGQYQFAYFGIHLLYMTYIYCSAWKISQIEPDRYKDAIIYARSYSGRENEFKIERFEKDMERKNAEIEELNEQVEMEKKDRQNKEKQ